MKHIKLFGELNESNEERTSISTDGIKEESRN